MTKKKEAGGLRPDDLKDAPIAEAGLRPPFGPEDGPDRIGAGDFTLDVASIEIESFDAAQGIESVESNISFEPANKSLDVGSIEIIASDAATDVAGPEASDVGNPDIQAEEDNV